MASVIVHKKLSYTLLLLFVLYMAYTIFYMIYVKESRLNRKNVVTKFAQNKLVKKTVAVYGSCIRQNWGLFTPIVHYNAEVYVYLKDTISNTVVDSIGMVSFFGKRKTNTWLLSSTHEAYDHLFYNCTYNYLKRYHVFKESSDLKNLENDSIASLQLKNIKAFIPIVIKHKNGLTMHKQYQLQFTYLPIADMNKKEQNLKPEILYTTSYFNL